MKWEYWIFQYTNKYCVARGLSPTSINTYQEVLRIFSMFMERKKSSLGPMGVTASDVYDFLEHLKTERGNGQASVFKNATIITRFFQGLVGLGAMYPDQNPMRDFKKVKPPARTFKDVLSRKEVKRLINTPQENTVLGIRDKAIILLLYSTGIRASECTALRQRDVDLEGNQIKVKGKGGAERIIPLNEMAKRFLKKYIKARGEISDNANFFKTRLGEGIKRKGLYDRIKKYVRLAKINKNIGPHNLRHTFATHQLKVGTNIITLRDLLGHRCLSSTQVYIRMTIEDLRAAIDKHPVNQFSEILDALLPAVRLPYQLSRSGFK